MLHTDPLYGLTQTFAYLDGLNISPKDSTTLARIALEYLCESGFELRHRKILPLSRLPTAEELRATRKALKVTNHRLAIAAGLSTTAVIAAQKAGAIVRPHIMEALVGALMSLGATLEEQTERSNPKAKCALPP